MQIMISIALAARQEAFVAQADVEPGGQTLDIAGEEIFARNRDAHFVQRADQHAVAGLAAGAVGRRDVDVEIIDDVLIYV
jgi:hypothetical protein